MVQVYADGVLAYDSRLDEYRLLTLVVTTSVDKAGTAIITMPPGHPAYDIFTSFKTEVSIYRGGVLLFRGRALYPQDDFYNCRTITCEGELNFFRDSVARPYTYQDGPAAIFAQVIELHNAQVDAYKQFRAGTVTVTDPNNYIRLEAEKAEQTSDTLAKLKDRCGGYFVFTSDAEGNRVINWYAELGYQSTQVIEFGENLLDFARTDANTDIVTVVIPYGAKDIETGERVTIESVNDGLDFIQDYDAVALRGVIARAVYWEDVTEPVNLLAKAQQYLADSRNIITSLTLQAVDLSVLDVNIDSYRVGDLIHVRSKPHKVDDWFRLTDRTEDLLNPANDAITLGKNVETLTGSDAAGEYKNASDLLHAEQQIIADYTANTAQAVQEATETLTSLIQQTAESIRLEVSEQVMTGEEIESMISTSMEQLSDSFTFTFNELQAVVDANDASAREQYSTLQKYIRFEDGNIILGEAGNELTLRIENDRISFLDDGAEVAYLSNKKLVVLDGWFIHSLRVGAFAALPRGNGNLSIVKVVE